MKNQGLFTILPQMKTSLGRKPLFLTVGNFDGVHLGHQKLIQRLVAQAKMADAKTCVLTFHPHPVQVLFPDLGHQRLFSLEDQKTQLLRLGVDEVCVQSFSRDFSLLTPDQFFDEILMKQFSPMGVIVGYDFSFGARRQGGADFLKAKCLKENILFEQVDAEWMDGQIISTTRIKKALDLGQVESAERWLGRPFSAGGVVIKGEQLGRKLGFPTANIQNSESYHPKTGVYAVRVHFDGKTLAGVMNLGRRPTIGNDLSIVPEVHILDFDEDIYGKSLKIDFAFRLRDEQKFSSLDELKKQIQKDADQARSLLK